MIEGTELNRKWTDIALVNILISHFWTVVIPHDCWNRQNNCLCTNNKYVLTQTHTLNNRQITRMCCFVRQRDWWHYYDTVISHHTTLLAHKCLTSRLCVNTIEWERAKASNQLSNYNYIAVEAGRKNKKQYSSYQLLNGTTEVHTSGFMKMNAKSLWMNYGLNSEFKNENV